MVVGDPKQFFISKKLKEFWKNNSLENMNKKNKDKVYIVDGMERCGKSTFAIQQACYIEPSLLDSPDKLCSRIVFDAEDFYNVCRTVKNGVIIFDEAFRGFASRSAMSKVNKKLVLTLMEMGQHSNIVFIILPRIFMLDIYPAMLRSNALFNIKETKSGQRIWRYYNYRDKNKIYQIGTKKGWDYVFDAKVKDPFRGKFPGGKEFEDAYLKKKAESFKDTKLNDNTDEKEMNEMRKKNLTWKEIGRIKGIPWETARKRWKGWLDTLNINNPLENEITPIKKEEDDSTPENLRLN